MNLSNVTSQEACSSRCSTPELRLRGEANVYPLVSLACLESIWPAPSARMRSHELFGASMTRPHPEGQDRDLRCTSKPAWKPPADRRPPFWLRRAARAASSLLETSVEVRSPALALGRAPKSSTLSCRPAAELRRAHQPANTSCRPHLRGSTCSVSGGQPRSEELDLPLPARLGAPKSSSPSWREPALAPPWKRLTTPGPRSSSEELSLKLPAGHSAPKGTEVDRRETAPRLLRNRCRPTAPRHTPKGRTPHQEHHLVPLGTLPQTLRPHDDPKTASAPRDA